MKAYKLPCLPHAVVAFVHPITGIVYRPHFWFILPYQSAVWWAPDNNRCRKDIMAFYTAVVLGCTSNLIPLGADLSAVTLPLKGKNPLSPLWTTEFWNEEYFPNLSTWAEYVSTQTSAGDVARSAVTRDSTCSTTQSAETFQMLQRTAFDMLRSLHRAGDPSYEAALRDRAALVQLLHDRCRKSLASATDDHHERRQIFAQFRHVAHYAAHAWDPLRASPAVDRGACRDKTKGHATTDRHAIGALYAAEQNAARCSRIVAETVRKMTIERAVISKAAVARRSGLSRPTVIKWWPL